MKGKYITTHVRMAYLSVPVGSKRNIHEQLEETIAERKKIMQRLENAILSFETNAILSFETQDSVIDLYLGTTKAA